MTMPDETAPVIGRSIHFGDCLVLDPDSPEDPKDWDEHQLWFSPFDELRAGVYDA